MQPTLFGLFAEAAGFDVVALQRMYGRAYSSLAIRLAEVMQHQPLLAVLYERRETGDPCLWPSASGPGSFKATVVARTPGFRLRMQRRPLSRLRGLLPRRGAPPAQGSVAERVALTGRAVYVDRVSGYDLWSDDDLAVAARPVNWHGRLAKIAVVAVPYRDRSVLRPQLGRAMSRTPHRRVILDGDSSVSPVHGEQEGAAYNGDFRSMCYHLLFVIGGPVKTARRPVLRSFGGFGLSPCPRRM